MAFVDLRSGKIYGAEKGTKTYLHEEAHLKYPEKKRGQIVRTWQDISLDFLIFSIAIQVIFPNIIFKYLIIILLLTKSISILIEEWDCWKEAEEKLKEEKKENGLQGEKIQKV
jgi:hypothetical protein